MVSSAFFFHLPKIWASAGTGAASDSAAAMIKIFDSLMIDWFSACPVFPIGTYNEIQKRGNLTFARSLTQGLRIAHLERTSNAEPTQI